VTAVRRAGKVLWPAAGFTKADLAAYYRAVAPALLPHLHERPLTLRRFPDGVDGPGWYQTQCRGAPPWLRTCTFGGRRGQVFRMCLADDERALHWLAEQATLELHPLLACCGALDRPRALVLDLDPGPPADVVDCCRVAVRARELLAHGRLEAFAKVSGAAGLHVLVPLAGGDAYGDTKPFARALASQLAADLPELVVTTQRREARAGRVLVDWLQNDPMRSLVAPYSLRALAYPTVSAPVTWDEVERAAADRRPDRLTFLPRDVVARLDRHGDLLLPALELDQRLPDAAP
jgi:bifunctional non-homologous end joining protein LigD